MIRIGLFSQPMNSEIPQYAGIYRLNNICDYEDISRDLGKSINWIYDNSNYGGMSVIYSIDNKKNIVKLYQNLINEKWEGDILLFGDGFLIKYDRDANVFDSELSLSDFFKYKNNINRQGLFSSLEVASDFAQYCNYINKKHFHAVESEDNWRVIELFRQYKVN